MKTCYCLPASLSGGLALLCLVSVAQAVQSYSAAFDFSLAANPNGEWSYRHVGSPLIETDNNGTTESWTLPDNPNDALGPLDGSVGRLLVTPGGWNDAGVGDLLLHARTTGGSVGVRWTSPGAGTIDISGKAWDAIHESGRDTRWELYLNSTLLAERNTVIGTLRDAPEAYFVNNLKAGQGLGSIPVGAGDSIEFQVFKVSSAPYAQYTGLSMVVVYTPVPEPAGATLVLALGVLLVGRRRGCRRN